MNVPHFLDGVIEHLKSYARSKGVPIEDVHLRFTLSDSTHVTVQGIRVEGPQGTHSWGMIRGLKGETAEALVIREDHVFCVEFQAEPIARLPAGLHSEVK